MARPKTEAATYVPMTFRIPPALRARVLQLIGNSGVPVNTKLAQLVELAVEVEEQSKTDKVKHAYSID